MERRSFLQASIEVNVDDDTSDAELSISLERGIYFIFDLQEVHFLLS